MQSFVVWFFFNIYVYLVVIPLMFITFCRKYLQHYKIPESLCLRLWSSNMKRPNSFQLLSILLGFPLVTHNIEANPMLFLSPVISLCFSHYALNRLHGKSTNPQIDSKKVSVENRLNQTDCILTTQMRQNTFLHDYSLTCFYYCTWMYLKCQCCGSDHFARLNGQAFRAGMIILMDGEQPLKELDQSTLRLMIHPSHQQVSNPSA